MDGFEVSLKKGLRRSMGDLSIHSRNGFFSFDSDIQSMLKKEGIESMAPLIKTEGFLINGTKAKGVLLRGVEPEEFSKVIRLDINLDRASIAIGTELAKLFDLKIGDEVVLAFASGNKEFDGVPTLESYKISGIVNHGIYQKDIRLVYINRQELQRVMGVDDRINIIFASLSKDKEINFEKLDIVIENLNQNLPSEFISRPYWKEFGYLLKAVKYEKAMISIIFQLVVVISVFNVLAFIIFLNEKRSKEIFLFRSMGLDQNSFVKLWLILIFLLWFFSCILSLAFTKLFDLALQYLSVLQLPNEIYLMERLSLSLEMNDYILVFGGALLWLVIFSWLILLRSKKRSLLVGLRKEFA
jgi:ABC-type lipoprotein release transport system permease subunit